MRSTRKDSRRAKARLWLLYPLLAACLGLPVQLRAQQILREPSAADKKCSVSGTVTNSVSGAPVARALVQIVSGSATQSVLTDLQGQFHFDEVTAGSVMLVARKPGFFNAQEMATQSHLSLFNNQFTTVGPDTGTVVLKLVPEGIVAGRVTYSDGEPIEGANVLVKSAGIIDGRNQWQQLGMANTDENGEYRIANLRPGTYYLEVQPGYVQANLPAADAPETHGYRATYYPSSTELSAAAPLEVQAGQKTEANFSLPAERLLQVSGVVEGTPTGRAVGLILMTSDGEPVPVPIFPQPGGGFQARSIPAGTYVLRANSQDEQGNQLTAQMPLTLSKDLSGVRLRLQPSASIPVVVQADKMETASSETPAATAETPVVSYTGSARFSRLARGNPAGVQVQLLSRDSQQSRVFASFEGSPEGPGLILRNVPAASYTTEVTANSPWYVQAVTSNGKDLLQEDLVVRPGGSTQPIEVVLRDDSGSINGTLQKGDNISGAFVLLVPSGRISHKPMVQPINYAIGFQPAMPQPNQFRFPGLRPGEYDLFAFDQVDGLEYANPEALQEYANHAVHVSLHAGETKTVGLELISREAP